MNDTLQEQDNPGVIAPPPLIYLAALLLGFLLHLRFRVRFLPRSWMRILLGGLLSTASMIIGSSAFREMRDAQTNVNPHEPSTTIVTAGPYQFTRNPIYVSLTLLYTGIAVMINALWLMLLLPFVLITMRFGVIEREERYLERKFGAQYLRYKSMVRRWL